MPGSLFNFKCPFHVAVATSIVVGSIFYISSLLYAEKKRKIERFDVDSRFTDAARHGSLVFISGQVGQGSTVEEQTKSALACVDQALAKAGTDKSKILEATIWLADMDAAYHDMNKVYDSWIIPGKPPCRACVQAKLASSDYLVEVRVIAAV